MKSKSKLVVEGYLFLFPLLFLLVGLSFYPLLRTIFLSFQDVRLAMLNRIHFVGFQNFRTILHGSSPSFWQVTVPNTLVYVFGSVVGQIGLGFLLASLVNRKDLHGRVFFRSIIVLPWVVSSIIISISWRFMYEPRLGILNFVLGHMGVENLPTWLNNPHLVLPCLIVANIWHGMPFSFIIQTSGLESIPEDLYDAAIVDGCNGWQRLHYITIPMIRQFLVMNLVMTSMNTMNSFDLIYATTKGGPLYKSEVIAVNMYRRAFDFGKLGEGSAVAALILLFNFAFTILYLRLNRSKIEI